jgi:urea transporter
MRKTSYLLGIMLTAGTLGIAALQSQAAEPAKARSTECSAKEIREGVACASARRVSATERVVTFQVTKATLDRNVCGRLQGQVERDTCLNHVEASA